MADSMQAIGDGDQVTTTDVGVIGLGYVGLPLLLSFAEAGLTVCGFDLDQSKVDDIAAGRSYLATISDARIAAVLQQITVTTDPAAASTCAALVICVPTPLDEHLQPDLSYVEGTCENFSPFLAAQTLVILESTTWPGTTLEKVVPLLESGSGRTVGQDLFVGYSPEREDPGNAKFETSRIPKLVAGVDALSADKACALYERAFAEVVRVGDTRVAEAAKLFENVFRSVNIALVNELKVIMDRMGIDVGEVIDAAATKPFGFMPFRPGPGLGGHCIPIDPFYLAWKAREFGIETKFIELAGEINRSMPQWVVSKVTDVLNDQGKAVRGSRILVLGVAYKGDVDDMRESPSLVLIDMLEARGATVSYSDPWLPEIPSSRQHPHLAGRRSVEPSGDFDLFLLATDHTAFGADLLDHGVPTVDTRRVLPPHDLVTRA